MPLPALVELLCSVSQQGNSGWPALPIFAGTLSRGAHWAIPPKHGVVVEKTGDLVMR
jgi:hypothetical protein